MDRYIVIGNPVEHSLSPEIHRAFAEQTQQDLEYATLFAPQDAFVSRITGFFDAGGRGANVTVPFKTEAHSWVDARDASAATTGAVNTIARDGELSVGYNTDGLGLIADLNALGIDVAGSRLLMLGAGGAARGVLGPLLAAGVADMVVANRTVTRAETLVTAFEGGTVNACGLEAVTGPFDVIINGTSAGLSGEAALIAPAAVQGAICYDLLYARDGATPFCDWAHAAGAARVVDGLGMLVEQAAAAFAIWRGVTPDARTVLAALRGYT
ncbi:MAG: shikimate dehydrogenase [Pseudomonadales bacterium]